MSEHKNRSGNKDALQQALIAVVGVVVAVSAHGGWRRVLGIALVVLAVVLLIASLRERRLQRREER